MVLITKMPLPLLTPMPTAMGMLMPMPTPTPMPMVAHVIGFGITKMPLVLLTPMPTAMGTLMPLPTPMPMDLHVIMCATYPLESRVLARPVFHCGPSVCKEAATNLCMGAVQEMQTVSAPMQSVPEHAEGPLN